MQTAINTNDNVNEEQKPQVLVDCYHATVATSMGDKYSEIVLYGHDDGSEELVVYEKGFSDVKEVSHSYPLAEKISDEIMRFVHREKVDTWLKMNYFNPICGANYVIKYYDGNKLVRIPSEKMPADGIKTFYRLCEILRSYISD